jgi:uncharacterized protein
MDRRFLILHGSPNRRPGGHWQWQLAEALRSDGEQVLHPQLPDPDAPTMALWLEVLRAELAHLGRGERVVVAHSLAALLWLHAVRVLDEDERVDRVLLVAPPSPAVVAGFPEVREFGDVRLDADDLARAAGSTRIVCGDDDPYCPEGARSVSTALRVPVEVLPGRGHLDLDAGYGGWPAVRQWCQDPTTTLVARTATAASPPT